MHAYSPPREPAQWLENHLNINAPGPDDHLFAWRHPNSLRPLTKLLVTIRVRNLVSQYDTLDLNGYSLRIGGTLRYLL